MNSSNGSGLILDSSQVDSLLIGARVSPRILVSFQLDFEGRRFLIRIPFFPFYGRPRLPARSSGGALFPPPPSTFVKPSHSGRCLTVGAAKTLPWTAGWRSRAGRGVSAPFLLPVEL